MKNTVHLIFCLLFLQVKAHAQNKSDRLTDSLFLSYKQQSTGGYADSTQFYILKSNVPNRPSFQLTRRISSTLFIAKIESKSQYDSLSLTHELAPANNAWKLSPTVGRTLKYTLNQTQKFILTGYNVDSLLTVLRRQSDNLQILSIHRPSHSVIIKTSPSVLQKELVGLKELIFVDIAAEAHPEADIIGYDRTFHGINAVDFLLPGANGKNIVAGVKEQKMDERDIDLWKRVLPSSLAAPTTSYHATVIASIIGGAGNSSYQGRGIAWACKFFPSSFANLFADDEAVLQANSVTVQNHSYGTVIQQHYGAEALSYDQLTWNNKTFIPVISAGNQGDSAATEGQYAHMPGFANLTGNFKMAKNIVTVGAIDNKGTISAQSSSGPVYDGRLAPHLMALGPNGTSDAAAVVTGTIAVMQQVHADSNSGAIPPSSLIKAVLFNTAEDIHQPGIDYKTGYGLLDSYAAVNAIRQKKFDGGNLSPGQPWKKTLEIPPGIQSLKITLAWTDTAASVNNNKAIIHDLDLEVTRESNGEIYQPWVLSSVPRKDSLEMRPTRRRDSLNTAEQVVIDLPTPGKYQIKVSGTTLNREDIPFHIAFNADTLNTFSFTSPLHAADVQSNEFEPSTIRWKTFPADTNQTGSLFVSYDSGSTWNSLVQSLKLTTGKYQWQVRDTTTIARLKMETPFGIFYSSDFVISAPTKIKVDFNCTDSFRLSWNPHPFATAYRIYALTENPYVQPVLTTTSSFAVLQKNTFPSQIYAVQPILNNGLPAARSAATDLNLQGVKCFYRTLYYNLLDGNQINLIIELSTAAQVDSIFFEHVSAGGDFLKTFGGLKVVQDKVQYNFVVEDVPPGITYIRGKIKLKDGSSVFTDVVPVLTSGKKSIWFYPNPARRQSLIKYVIRQGVPASSSLQLFDARGIPLRSYAELPNQIDAANLPSGLIIYRLFDTQNKLIEAGKLIIQ